MVPMVAKHDHDALPLGSRWVEELMDGWIRGRLCMHQLDPGGYLGQRYHGLTVGYDTVGSFSYARLSAWQLWFF
jgi:hypothetical protein